MSSKIKIRSSIFIPMSLIFLSSILLGILSPEKFYNLENYIVQFAFDKFGWLFQLSSLFFLLVCVFLMLSKFGNIRFGGKDAKPTMSNWTWFSITLCAGIGTGIMFWGIAEPITHFMNPPDYLNFAAGSESAATFALVTSYIHWTFIPYAMYSIIGIGSAYVVYNLNMPFQVSSLLYPIFGRKINKTVIAIIDNLCIFSMAGGIAAILGVATMQLGSGMEELIGLSPNRIVWIAIVGTIVVSFIFSSYIGIQKGMKWLSDKNSKIYIAILAFIFIFGPTTFILSLGTQATGEFIGTFFERTTILSPIIGSQWPRWWPIYYWAIWVAYAPISGMFFGSIAKGRTIREFLFYNLILPAVFGIIWFAIFGSAAIHQQLNGTDLWGVIQNKGLEVSIYAFLKNYPLTKIFSWIMVITIVISVITLCDSMTGTISKMSTIGDYSDSQEAPGYIKIFWGLVMSSLAIVNLLSPEGKISGIDATKMISTVAGFPLLFLMILLTCSILYMIIKGDKHEIVCAEEDYEYKSPNSAIFDSEIN